MTKDSPKLTAERDFLFVIEIKNDTYYHNQNELIEFLKVLPTTIRVYAVIHAGMMTLKVYCITKSIVDYEMVETLTGAKTEIVDTSKFSGNSSSSLN